FSTHRAIEVCEGLELLIHIVNGQTKPRVEHHRFVEVELFFEDSVALATLGRTRILSSVGALSLSARLSRREIQHHKDDYRDRKERGKHQEDAFDDIRGHAA